MRDIDDEKILEHLQAEVTDFYTRQRLPPAGNEKHSVAEEEVLYDHFTCLPDDETSFNYFQATLTEHVFMVKHSDEPTNWRYIHNAKAIKVIRKLLRCDPRLFNLVDEFKQKTKSILPAYIEEAKNPSFNMAWGDIDLGEGTKKNGFIIDPPLEEGKKSLTLIPRKYNDIWEDVSEGEHPLLGNVLRTATEYYFVIPVPGVTDLSSVQIELLGHVGISIAVSIPEYKPQASKIDYALRNWICGLAKFRYTCPDDLPFVLPSDMSKVATLDSGVLVVKLTIEKVTQVLSKPQPKV